MSAELKQAVDVEPRSRGWQRRLAKRFSVSRQRIWQIAQDLNGQCQGCGRGKNRGIFCEACHAKNRNKIARLRAARKNPTP